MNDNHSTKRNATDLAGQTDQSPKVVTTGRLPTHVTGALHDVANVLLAACTRLAAGPVSALTGPVAARAGRQRHRQLQGIGDGPGNGAHGGQGVAQFAADLSGMLGCNGSQRGQRIVRLVHSSVMVLLSAVCLIVQAGERSQVLGRDGGQGGQGISDPKGLPLGLVLEVLGVCSG